MSEGGGHHHHHHHKQSTDSVDSNRASSSGTGSNYNKKPPVTPKGQKHAPHRGRVESREQGDRPQVVPSTGPGMPKTKRMQLVDEAIKKIWPTEDHFIAHKKRSGARSDTREKEFYFLDNTGLLKDVYDEFENDGTQLRIAVTDLAIKIFERAQAKQEAREKYKADPTAESKKKTDSRSETRTAPNKTQQKTSAELFPFQLQVHQYHADCPDRRRGMTQDDWEKLAAEVTIKLLTSGNLAKAPMRYMEDGMYGRFRPETAEFQSTLVRYVSETLVEGRRFKAWTREEIVPTTTRVKVCTNNNVNIYKQVLKSSYDKVVKAMWDFKNNGLSDLDAESCKAVGSGDAMDTKTGVEYCYITLEVDIDGWNHLQNKGKLLVGAEEWGLFSGPVPLHHCRGFPPLMRKKPKATAAAASSSPTMAQVVSGIVPLSPKLPAQEPMEEEEVKASETVAGSTPPSDNNEEEDKMDEDVDIAGANVGGGEDLDEDILDEEEDDDEASSSNKSKQQD